MVRGSCAWTSRRYRKIGRPALCCPSRMGRPWLELAKQGGCRVSFAGQGEGVSTAASASPHRLCLARTPLARGHGAGFSRHLRRVPSFGARGRAVSARPLRASLRSDKSGPIVRLSRRTLSAAPNRRGRWLEGPVKCPRCGSNSVVNSHDSVACVACGHILREPPREATDAAWFHGGTGDHLGPPLTPAEELGLGRPRKPRREADG